MEEKLSIAEDLLTGPRGRRLLLKFALEAERVHGVKQGRDSLRYAVVRASHHLEPGQGAVYRSGAESVWRTVITPEEVAYRLSEMTLPAVTPSMLRSALAEAVNAAQYWQKPEGEDTLAATEPVQRELGRVAEHIARSPHSDWWTTALVATDQWSVWSWDDGRPDYLAGPESTEAERLRKWRERTRENEARAARDPIYSCSDGWWSTPPTLFSTRRLFDGAPACLWFVEDGMGWKRAVTRQVSAPVNARVYEIDRAQAWAELCRRFPIEVTAQKRNDWYLTTGRSGRWVVPDWTQVADEYEGVHLTVAGYLAAAGTAIDATDDTASVIAGWAPDETYWLTDSATSNGDSRSWVCDTSDTYPFWDEEPQ
ncbi:hypothetical protein GCM10011410_21880 [Hoyosella rhizosphaerae]|uniref:Uncharacterized protein n=2 Tax=Hoyosella rhizosphaerae TaxID=1755582 RepID=A0A916XF47_9ACTN|nr:hypothetical protein GCM10011410_21880 [Hoyosella rhizosphaerae]